MIRSRFLPTMGLALLVALSLKPTGAVADVIGPPSLTCRLCFFSVITHDCTNSLTLVATSKAGAPFPFGSVGVVLTPSPPDAPVRSVVTRSDRLALDALYPVGDTLLTEVSTDAAGNQSSCTATVSVLPSFVRLASQVYLQYRVPAPGGPVEFMDLNGLADVRLDVNYPNMPGDPTRLHALINLHDVVAIWNGVQYHATNNVEAKLTSNQLSPISLTVPGLYKFEAHGKAAVHSFWLSLPLQAQIIGGTLAPLPSFGPPLFMAMQSGDGPG